MDNKFGTHGLDVIIAIGSKAIINQIQDICSDGQHNHVKSVAIPLLL